MNDPRHNSSARVREKKPRSYQRASATAPPLNYEDALVLDYIYITRGPDDDDARTRGNKVCAVVRASLHISMLNII